MPGTFLGLKRPSIYDIMQEIIGIFGSFILKMIDRSAEMPGRKEEKELPDENSDCISIFLS